MFRVSFRRLRSARAVFLSILIVGCALRLAYGVARYDESLSYTGADFIALWDYDALEHVLISKSLVEEGEYRVAWAPGLESKHVRGVGHDAAFKAPFYQFFLAGVFAISGYSFLLFFPLQALAGGILSGLVALIALETFHRRSVAVFAGISAAIHPVLVNSASQPYNENLYLALLFGSLWAFVRWLHAPRIAWALASGALAGLAILSRESAAPLLLLLAGFALVVSPAGRRQTTVAVFAMIAAAGLIVAPWLMRNLVGHGTLSISSGSAHALGIGNNECVAREPISTAYWAEDACAATDALRERLLMELPVDQRGNAAVTQRIDGVLGKAFIAEHPVDYVKLSIRRAWTLLLPFHPRQQTGVVQRAALLLYWLLILAPGIAGMVLALRGFRADAVLLALVVAAITLPLVLIYFSPDNRYRTAADLLMTCFAGHLYAQVAARSHRAEHYAGQVTVPVERFRS